MTLTAICRGITLCLGCTAKRQLNFKLDNVEKHKTKKWSCWPVICAARCVF